MMTKAPFFWAASVIAIAAVASCERRNTNIDAGPDDALNDDALLNGDTLNIGLSADFTISNCPRVPDAGSDGDAGLAVGCCRIPAPATVNFVPITAGAPDRQLWQFGDEMSSTLVTPTHTYALPEKYDVTLVIGGANGSVSVTKRACVDVVANALGAPCDVDIQCAAGATCTCGSQDQCGAPFLRGLCTQGCRDLPCPGSAVCADLSLGGAATAESPWRNPLCLAPCASSKECPSGTTCRDLPSRFPAGKWLKACFPAFPLPIGSACRRPQGPLDSPSCISGLCADLGALGQCTISCETNECPRGTSCAMLSTGEKRCLVDCIVGEGCGDDPWLSCQQATNMPATFSIDPGSSKLVCAPKPCSADNDCTGGSCDRPDAGIGHCVHR
jgi:PKD repeat protein